MFKVLLQLGTITLYSLIGNLMWKSNSDQESNKKYDRKSVEFTNQNNKKDSLSNLSDSLLNLSGTYCENVDIPKRYSLTLIIFIRVYKNCLINPVSRILHLYLKPPKFIDRHYPQLLLKSQR